MTTKQQDITAYKLAKECASIAEDKKAEDIVELADKNKAEIVIFSSEGDAGLKLKGFGKIAALLKFKIRE